MTDPRSEFAARGGREADWSEAVYILGGDVRPGTCAVIVITADDVPALMPNPDTACEDPEHVFSEAAMLVDAFRAFGPDPLPGEAPAWEPMPGGGYLSGLGNPNFA